MEPNRGDPNYGNGPAEGQEAPGDDPALSGGIGPFAAPVNLWVTSPSHADTLQQRSTGVDQVQTSFDVVTASPFGSAQASPNQLHFPQGIQQQFPNNLDPDAWSAALSSEFQASLDQGGMAHFSLPSQQQQLSNYQHQQRHSQAHQRGEQQQRQQQQQQEQHIPLTIGQPSGVPAHWTQAPWHPQPSPSDPFFNLSDNIAITNSSGSQQAQPSLSQHQHHPTFPDHQRQRQDSHQPPPQQQQQQRDQRVHAQMPVRRHSSFVAADGHPWDSHLATSGFATPHADFLHQRHYAAASSAAVAAVAAASNASINTSSSSLSSAPDQQHLAPVNMYAPFAPNSSLQMASPTGFLDLRHHQHQQQQQQHPPGLSLPPPNPPREADLQASAAAETPKRATAACRFCRVRKLRCDGSQPCRQCERRNIECFYPPVLQTKSRKRKDQDQDQDPSSLTTPTSATSAAFGGGNGSGSGSGGGGGGNSEAPPSKRVSPVRRKSLPAATASGITSLASSSKPVVMSSPQNASLASPSVQQQPSVLSRSPSSMGKRPGEISRQDSDRKDKYLRSMSWHQAADNAEDNEDRDGGALGFDRGGQKAGGRAQEMGPFLLSLGSLPPPLKVDADRPYTSVLASPGLDEYITAEPSGSSIDDGGDAPNGRQQTNDKAAKRKGDTFVDLVDEHETDDIEDDITSSDERLANKELAATGATLMLPRGNAPNDDWWNDLLGYFGPNKSLSTQSVNKLLRQFVVRNPVFFGLLHMPTLMGRIRTPEMRRSAEPALYFGVVSVAICDILSTKPEPWTADIEAADEHIRAFAIRLSRSGRGYLERQLVSTQSPSLETGQAASVLAMLETNSSADQANLIRILEGIVTSFATSGSASALSGKGNAAPIAEGPSDPVYYKRPSKLPSIQAEINREAMTRLCWSSCSHWSRMVIKQPDLDFGPGLEVLDQIQPMTAWEPTRLPQVLPDAFYRSMDFMRAGAELGRLQHSVWNLKILGTEASSSATGTSPTLESLEYLVRLEKLETHFKRFMPSISAQRDRLLTAGAEMLGRCMVATRMSLWRKTGLFRIGGGAGRRAAVANFNDLPTSVQFWFDLFTEATESVEGENGRLDAVFASAAPASFSRVADYGTKATMTQIRRAFDSKLSSPELTSIMHHVRLALQISRASLHIEKIEPLVRRMLDALFSHANHLNRRSELEDKVTNVKRQSLARGFAEDVAKLLNDTEEIYGALRQAETDPAQDVRTLSSYATSGMTDERQADEHGGLFPIEITIPPLPTSTTTDITKIPTTSA